MPARFTLKQFCRNLYGKVSFCFTHCVCINRCIKKTFLEQEYYTKDPDFDTHPIHDLEKGQL